MPKIFQPTRKGIRELTEYIKRGGKGTTVYTITQHKDWGLGVEHTYSEWVFTNRQPLTGIWQSGHVSAAGLLAGWGRVYTEPPRGIRNSADPAPQVAGPLGHGEYFGVLDEAEIRHLQKRLRDAPHPGTRRI